MPAQRLRITDSMRRVVAERTWKTPRMAIAVRTAIPRDAPRLQAIEREAGEQFRTVGMPEIADADPFTVEELIAYMDDGRCWVAVDGGTVVGYLVIDHIGQVAHIEQVSVVPKAQGRGVCRTLMARAREWAQTFGCGALTLTTFRDVAWNEPLYAHLGFRRLGEDELTPDLLAVRDREAAHGLDPARRVCMRLELPMGSDA